MAGWDGSGNWSWSYSWVNEEALSQYIDATKFDAQFADAKAGFENCLTRDGQGKPSANIDWNAKKITNLANGTASGDAINLSQLTGISSGNAFRRNMLVNGGFDVWQAGAGGSASIAGAATRTRTADCWWAIRAGTTGYTVSQQTGTANRYALKWQRNSGNASTEAMYLAQSLETADVVWLKRGTPPTLTVSFYAKTGANYSGGDMTTALIRGTGTDENVLDTYTGATTLGSLVQTLTGTLTRYQFSAAADTSTNELGVRFSWTPTGSAGADDSITIENVQVEVASAATDFEHLPFGDTLRMCQRYYQKSFTYTVAPAQNLGVQQGEVFIPVLKTAGGQQHSIPLPVAMHYHITAGVIYNPQAANAQVRNRTTSADCSSSSLYLHAGSPASLFLYFVHDAGATVGDTGVLSYVIANPNF